MTLFLEYQKQPFRGARKDTTPMYVFKFQENVSRKVRHHLKGSCAPVNDYYWRFSRYFFSIITNPLNLIRCSFEKIRSHKNISSKAFSPGSVIQTRRNFRVNGKL